MTRNNKHTTRSKFLLTLIVIGLLCTSLFLFTACSKETTDTPTENTTTYTYTEEDSTPISNTSFVFGTAPVELDGYPKSSITGWSKKTESGMTSSSAKSGVIDTSDAAWKELLNTLYNDSYFLNYFKVQYGFENTDVEKALGITSGDDDYSTKLRNYVIENYFQSEEIFKYGKFKNEFKNPGAHAGATDSKVYMLNNYLTKSKVGLGTAQNITSSSTVTLNKGEYGKITVWVNTQNLSGVYTDGTTTRHHGANVRIKNSFAGSSQADFGIFNIDTDGKWQQYTLYVQADKYYGCTFSVILGLGYDKLSATEGTAYFDDVVYTPLTAEEFAAETNAPTSANTKTFTLGSEDAVKIYDKDINDGTTIAPVLYNMDFAEQYNAKTVASSLSVFSHDYTQSNKTVNGQPVNGKRFGDDSSVTADTTSGNLVLNLQNASYTVLVGSKTNKLSVEKKSYTYIQFFVKNNLSKFGSTSITLDVYDLNGDLVKKRAAVATLSEVSDEWQKMSVVINNNFDYDREFYMALVVGPTDVATTDFVSDYASGTVEITVPTGIGYEFDEDLDDTVENFVEFLKSNANGTTALYAGSASDFAEDTEDEDTYNLSVAPSDKGTIETSPAIPSGYQGVTANHFYIKEDGENVDRDINSSDTAGLINTKYLTAYTMLPELDSKLAFTPTEKVKSIQPLVIYNDGTNQTHYGYVGAQKTVSASSYAKVSVKLRVVGATAYIYLVDTTSAEKSVMTFSDFSTAYDKNGTSLAESKDYKGSDLSLEFKVTDDTIKDYGTDGWVTVEFFVATGATAKDFRVEIWNGGRDGADATKSTGYVFVQEINVSTTGAFTEAGKWSDAFYVSGNPLFDVGIGSFDDNDQLIMFKRALTDVEEKFNGEQTDTSKIISYNVNYVWAKNETMVYAVFNTIDPVEVDPYANEEETEEEEEESGCSAKTDPSAFWLSFSSILLGVVLVFAIGMLIVKNVRRRRKANASDAKSHYTVKSRTRSAKDIKSAKKDVSPATEEDDNDEVEEFIEEETEETAQESTENTENKEQSLDDYVYGDVQDFGETEDNAEKQETSEEENK